LIALFVGIGLGAASSGSKTKTTTVTAPPQTVVQTVPGPTQTVKVPGPTKTVTVPGPTKTVTVPGPTKTVTVQSGSGSSSTGGASGNVQRFHGTNDENIGTIHVAQDSTLSWTTSAPNDNFIIDNDFNDDNTIDVNSLNQGSGKTVVPAGDYHKVAVTAGGDWSFTITPGNSTQ
jgi:hypothetical protein